MFRPFPTGLKRGSGAIALYKAFVIIDYLLFEDNALKIRVFHDHFVTVKQI